MAQQYKQIRTLEMQQDLDFFANIPSEIMIEILSRLAIPTVMRCKRVCKSWLSLVESLEFAKSHVSKSVAAPGPALDEGRPLTVALFRDEKISKPYEILELVDSQDSGNRCNVVFEFNFPHPTLQIHSSADGLLFMFDEFENGPLNLFICNPITREYMKLSPLSLPPPPLLGVSLMDEAFGFGVSKLTGKYKVVRIFKDFYVDSLFLPCKCEVYTLGTGSWRSVAAHGGLFWCSITSSSVFLNGNLHWLVKDSEHELFSQRISYFDLETECFSTFSIPNSYGLTRLCALGHSLCLCQNTGHGIHIWLMNKYGDDNSWREEFVIEKHPQRCPERLGAIAPIKMFKNGDILFVYKLCAKLFCYSSNTKTIREVDVTEPFADLRFQPSIYVPSFLPLKTFAMEKVSSF